MSETLNIVHDNNLNELFRQYINLIISLELWLDIILTRNNLKLEIILTRIKVWY